MVEGGEGSSQVIERLLRARVRLKKQLKWRQKPRKVEGRGITSEVGYRKRSRAVLSRSSHVRVHVHVQIFMCSTGKVKHFEQVNCIH